MSEKQEAKKATRVAYNSRINGIVRYRVSYEGVFPYWEVANLVRLPETSELTEHRFCWQELVRAFDKAWQGFSRRQAA